MASDLVYSCDVCGKQKGEVNHWWLYEVDAEEPTTWSVWPWTKDWAAKLKSACGQECITKALTQWMEQIRVAAEKQNQA